MNPKSYILLLLSTLLATTAFSQNIEFIENKGQWDNKVLFMGKVPAGAFFIHKDGFTVLQHNADDWSRLHEYTHNKGVVENSRIANNNGLIVRSHAYTVDFEGANPKSQVIADKPLIRNLPLDVAPHQAMQWLCQLRETVGQRRVFVAIPAR